MKVDTDVVKAVLHRHSLSGATIENIIKDIRDELAADEGETEKQPQVKKKFVAVRQKGNAGVFIAQIPEDDDEVTTLDKINRSAEEFNRSKKGRRAPVSTVAEACEWVPAKFFKENHVWMKTKDPVMVLDVDPKLVKGGVE